MAVVNYLHQCQQKIMLLKDIRSIKKIKLNCPIKKAELKQVLAFFVYYENADLVYDVIRMRQLSKQTLHELSPNDNS